MGKEMKQTSSNRAIIVAVILFYVALICVANAAAPSPSPTTIPEDETQINTWFQNVIKPFGLRKGVLDADITEAESAPEIITVKKDGSGKFKTITEAVNSIDNKNTNRVIISIGPGEYNEKIKVERFKPYVAFYGDPQNMPTLVFGGTAAEFGTVYSATLTVESDNFIAANLIIKNSAPRPTGKKKDEQALAVRLYGDEAAFYNCKFLGFQDTVCDDRGKHFFKDCYIEGTVDFIFGEGRSIYLNTEIHIIPGDPIAYIVASARKNVQGEGGYSFVHCKVTGSGGIGFLARAWMEAGRAVYSYCDMTDVVNPLGWDDKQQTQVHQTVFFAEYKNKGVGAVNKSRVSYSKQLSDAEAQQFITLDYIEADRWLLPPPKV